MINDKVSPAGEYYEELRLPMLSLIKDTPKRVLEIGCASGQTLAYLKERGAELTVGVEYSPEVAERARSRNGVDRVIAGNVETIDLDFEENSFDLILVGHVLEHLVDPWTVLRRLRALLKPQGRLVGALPNVRHYSVVLPLFFSGKWHYEKSGIMDWTHLRFFTRQSAIDLLTTSGLRVETIQPDAGRRSRMIDRLSFGILSDFLCHAYNFSSLKA